VQFKYDDKSFKLSVDIIITTLPDPSWTLGRYSELSALRLADQLGTETAPEKKAVTLAGQKAYRVEYSSGEGKKLARFVQTYTLHDGRAFILTAMTTTPLDDNRPFPVFERILSSFEFLPKGFTSKKHLFVYEHLIHKISFEFGSDFVIRDGMMMTLVSLEHGTRDSGPGFRSNLNLVLSDVPESADLDSFSEIVNEQLQMAVEDLHVVEGKASTLGGLPAKELIYTGKIADKEFCFLQTFTIKNATAFVISFSALQPDFESELVHARPVISSFAFF
jgi:hypothetical protein